MTDRTDMVHVSTITADTFQPKHSQPGEALHPVDNVHPVVSDTSAPGVLLVEFDSVLGQDCQPLTKVNAGTTVTAEVTIRTITPAAGGRARGIADGPQGWAVFTVPAAFWPRLRADLSAGGRVTIRGTVKQIASMPVIDVFAARAVSV